MPWSGRKFWPTIVKEYNMHIKSLLLPIFVDFSCIWIPYCEWEIRQCFEKYTGVVQLQIRNIEPADCPLNDVFSHRKIKESTFQKSKLTVFIYDITLTMQIGIYNIWDKFFPQTGNVGSVVNVFDFNIWCNRAVIHLFISFSIIYSIFYQTLY